MPLLVNTWKTGMEASMKVPPKRKGNLSRFPLRVGLVFLASMKVPPKRKGNTLTANRRKTRPSASMKVPPKRKGNEEKRASWEKLMCLNESPSEKEGKYHLFAHSRL